MNLIESEKNQGRWNYLTISKGSFIQKTTAEDNHPKTQKRVKMDGSVVYERVYSQGDKVFGRLVGLSIKSFEFKDKVITNFNVDVRGEGVTTRISFNIDSKFFNSFAEVLPNIDTTKDVLISVYDYTSKKDGKRRVGTSVSQEGERIRNFYSNYEEGVGFVYQNGFPEPSPKIRLEKNDTIRKKLWQNYFQEVDLFLLSETQKFVDGFQEATMEDFKEFAESSGVPAPTDKDDTRIDDEDIEDIDLDSIPV